MIRDDKNKRMPTGQNTETTILALLETVTDPEIPVLSVTDLGIIRKIETGAGSRSVRVTITPTYSGCPAMDVIAGDIRKVLERHGYTDVQILTELSPAWTTDWMSEAGKAKLKAYGIAPPLHSQQVCTTRLFHEEEAIACPRCHSYNTRLVSRFGSTPCKALYQCQDCQEPFDYFKCH